MTLIDGHNRLAAYLMGDPKVPPPDDEDEDDDDDFDDEDDDLDE
jgi:hypothetical protein